MYTKDDLKRDIENLGIKSDDTLLIHSSMKAIGQVEGGADTVLVAFMEYMNKGLLIMPTHSWNTINKDNNVFDPLKEPSCVGILTNLFMKRSGVTRSWHPTHSVAAYGRESKDYTTGEENTRTPCPRTGCWGKLYDRSAKILFLGCPMIRNTFIHGVEEWNGIDNRLAKKPTDLKIKSPDGKLIDCPQYTHHAPINDISLNYNKIKAALLHKGIAGKGKIGDAESYLCDAVGMADLTGEFLSKNPDLFIDDKPIPEEWYL